MSFSVLIMGTDINAYYMARCYHEIFNKKVDMMGKKLFGVTQYSNIINFTKVPLIDERETFIDALNRYAKEKSDEKIVLIVTNDKLVRLIVENKNVLDEKFVFNYPNIDIVNKLLLKDNFYKAYKDDLNIPKTFIYSCIDKPELNNDFTYPIILKPANGIEYNRHYFSGMSKVYKIQSFELLKKAIEMIIESGYNGNLIIQEFIPGDDCALYDAVFYCGKDKKVKLMTFAQIGLQERTKTGVGNCTVLVNGFDENGYKEDVIYKMRDFLEKIGYQGFAEFDLKYDIRDGSYKVLEINPRQARSSYYLSACGHNLVKYLIDDLIYNKEMPRTLIRDKVVLSFVPKSVIKKYVTSVVLQNEIQDLIRKGKLILPLYYDGDRSLKRSLYLFLKNINYMIKYRKLTW